MGKKKEDGSIVYVANGEEVTINQDYITKYLVHGAGTPTKSEIFEFMNLCVFNHLNPYIKDAYLVKYSNNKPAQCIVSTKVFLKRAEANPDYRGTQSGIIVLKENGEIENRKGTFKLKSEKLVGAWAEVYVNGFEKPVYESVTFDEYVGVKADGKANSMWSSKPATMIKKVALAHALREAFPTSVTGMYIAEEMQVDLANKEKETEKTSTEEFTLEEDINEK